MIVVFFEGLDGEQLAALSGGAGEAVDGIAVTQGVQRFAQQDQGLALAGFVVGSADAAGQRIGLIDHDRRHACVGCLVHLAALAELLSNMQYVM